MATAADHDRRLTAKSGHSINHILYYNRYMFHIIEDDEILLEILASMIADAGYDCLRFKSGDKYMDHLNSPEFECPTAILSDISMPGIHGYDLALETRKRYPFQKIVLISGTPNEKFDEQAAEQLCYSACKPCEAEKLFALLTSLTNCEEAHKTGDKSDYSQFCEFGLDHECPFHKIN